MNITSKPIWRKANGGYLIACIAVLLLLHSSTVSGQDFEQTYERALLDSAYRFELLKPAYIDLKIVTKLQNERYQASEKRRMFEGQLCEVQAKRIQGEERKTRRKHFWKGFKAGTIIAIIVTSSLLLF